MHDLDKEVHQTINDLLSPLPTEGCKHGIPNRLGVSTHLTRRLDRSPEAILAEDFRLYRCEEAVGELQCLNLAQLLQLTKHTLETDTTRIRLQDTERGTAPVCPLVCILIGACDGRIDQGIHRFPCTG